MPRHKTKTSFVAGHITWNKKRDSIKDLCPECGVNLKGVYYTRCKTCGYAHRRNSQVSRRWANGYTYSEGGQRPRPEHIVIAERVLGRALKKGECVHHINMMKDDNRPSNLLICDPVYHAYLHMAYARKYAEGSFDYVPRSL